MSLRRKLIKIEELADIMAVHHQVENTQIHVIELLLFGFAYSSRYIQLKTNAYLEKLQDDDFKKEICAHPSRFGVKLEFGSDLEQEPDGTIFYIGEVAEGAEVSGS
jgi:hypothetical protein